MIKSAQWTSTRRLIESVEKMDVSTVSDTIYTFKPRDKAYELHIDEAREDDGHVLLYQEPNAAVPVQIPVEIPGQPVLGTPSHQH